MNNFKFTSSPWGFRKTLFANQLKWLRDNGIGYYCGQFFSGEQGLFEPNIPEDELMRILRLINAYDMKCASFNVNGDFMTPDIESEIAKCCGEIDKAAKFLPEVLIVFAGWQDREDDAIYLQVIKSLKKIAKHAAKYNLTVALENHGGLTATPVQVNRILEGVNEPNIGLNYDPANFLMYGVDPFKALMEIKYPVVFTHFKSLRNVKGKKEYCRISEGEIDYKSIIKVLNQMKYDGFYAIEYEEPFDVFEGSQNDLDTLKEMLDID